MRIESIYELPKVTIPKAKKAERSTFHSILEEKHAQLSNQGDSIDDHSHSFTVPELTESEKMERVKALQELIQSLIVQLATDPSPVIQQRIKEARAELSVLIHSIHLL